MVSLFTRAGAAVLAMATVLGTTVFVACSSSDEGSEPLPEGDGSTGGEPLFRIVQRDLIVRCGGVNGSCHVRGATAPHWLGDPDPYVSAKKYAGILPETNDPGDSTLLTQVPHAGPSLKGFPELYSHVADWISAELPKPPLPNTGAFQVAEGFNAINLNAIQAGLDGARITFLALEATPGTLSLSAIRVSAPQNMNVKFDAPFFVILPRSGKVKAQPSVNGFQGELTVPAGTTVDLYTGKMILTGWDPGGRLKIAFKKIESTPGMGPSGGCKALSVFTSKALPQMRTQIDITDDDENDGGTFDGGVTGQGSCVGCHGQADDPTTGPTSAVLAMDLRAVDSDPAIACAFARQHINFQNKPMSLILLNPTGKANPNHPIVPLADNHPVIEGIREWVNAEQP